MAKQVLTTSKFLANPSQLAVVAAKYSCRAPRKSAEQGPDALLDSGILSNIQSETNYKLTIDHLTQNGTFSNSKEANNTDPDTNNMKLPRTVRLASKQVSESVYTHARQGKFVMTLGGDHSIGMGTVTGVARAIRERFGDSELSVLWIDAHADINTPETSPSGRIHGMPVAFASGLARYGIFDWITASHLINLKRFVYIGLRDVDEAEEKARYRKVMDLALEYLGDETPIHVSYDIDSLDPEWVPSTGFPVSPGLSLDEGILISRRLHNTGNLVAMDLVEVNPLIEPEKLDLTVESARSIIHAALGVEGKGF
ncbi:hypothetical protein VI817_006960 [Penicillium citrinum]|nr:hypothetical protein VI817_006960 [Penicillium citrinum]